MRKLIFSGAFVAVFVKLILGAGQYIIQKDALHAHVTNLAGKTVEFQRRYFFTAANFLAMLLVVLPLIPGQWRKFQAQRQSPVLGTGVAGGMSEYSWKLALFSAFPGALDVAAVLISMEATVYLPASVVVLLKATRVIFAAGLTAVMLRKRVTPQQWAGVGITCMALVPIFFESMQHAAMEKDRLNEVMERAGKEPKPDEVTTTAEVFKGLGLILLAELMRAVRFVYEEWLIKKRNMATEFLLITECSFGAVLACLTCLGAHVFHTENYQESWHMFKSSSNLQALLITYCVIAGICNIAGTFITKYLSSVVNALVSELRVVLVFIPNVIRYQLDKSNADRDARKVKGEPFDGWSALKILGFALLVIGAYVYNGTIKLPCVQCKPPAGQSPKHNKQATGDDDAPSLAESEENNHYQQRQVTAAVV